MSLDNDVLRQVMILNDSILAKGGNPLTAHGVESSLQYVASSKLMAAAITGWLCAADADSKIVASHIMHCHSKLHVYDFLDAITPEEMQEYFEAKQAAALKDEGDPDAV